MGCCLGRRRHPWSGSAPLRRHHGQVALRVAIRRQVTLGAAASACRGIHGPRCSRATSTTSRRHRRRVAAEGDQLAHRREGRGGPQEPAALARAPPSLHLVPPPGIPTVERRPIVIGKKLLSPEVIIFFWL